MAIIGLGTIGRRYIEVFNNHDGFELVGGFDVGEQARTAAAADFGMRVTASAEELITDPNVHVVYIATPPLYHEVYVDQVQAAGKAIFCEKPLGVDNGDTQAMVERVESAGAPAAVNFVFGAAPSAVEMIKQVRERRVRHRARRRLAGALLPVATRLAGRCWLAPRPGPGRLGPRSCFALRVSHPPVVRTGNDRAGPRWLP